MLKVDTSCMETQAQRMNRIAEQLEDIASRVASVNRTLRWNTSIDYAVRRNLTAYNKTLSDFDNKAKQLSQVLTSAASQYNKAETNAKSCNGERVLSAVEFITPIIVGPGGQLKDFITQINELIKNTTIDKSTAIPAILSIVSPMAGLIYITGGIPNGNVISFRDWSRTPSSDAGAEWLGYEFAEDHPGVTAWGGKAYAETQNEWGYAGVNAYLGKVDANVKADGGFMEKKKEREFKDGKWSEKESFELLHGEVGAGVEVNAVAVDGKAGLGSDMLGVGVEGEGSLGNAELSGKGKLSIGTDGIDANLQGKAMVSAAEGEIEGSINILGIEITGSIGGYAGALGAEGKVGFDDGKFVSEVGAAALLGVSVGVEIGFNEEGWDNFVDFVTFWD